MVLQIDPFIGSPSSSAALCVIQPIAVGVLGQQQDQAED